MQELLQKIFGVKLAQYESLVISNDTKDQGHKLKNELTDISRTIFHSGEQQYRDVYFGMLDAINTITKSKISKMSELEVATRNVYGLTF
jgi:hypothetical protein